MKFEATLKSASLLGVIHVVAGMATLFTSLSLEISQGAVVFIGLLYGLVMSVTSYIWVIGFPFNLNSVKRMFCWWLCGGGLLALGGLVSNIWS